MNALSVAAMDHDLLLSCVAIEAGTDIRCVPKIRCENPDEIFNSENLKDDDATMKLKLNGFFSHYP